MAAGLSPINRALNRIPKRAEQRQAGQLQNTFVDSGVAAALEAMDHQVLYGRWGTGKTHAACRGANSGTGDIVVYADLRTIGSPDGLFLADDAPATRRAAKLLVDLLSHVHEELLVAAVNDETLIEDVVFVDRLDGLAAGISSVHDVEVSPTWGWTPFPVISPKVTGMSTALRPTRWPGEWPRPATATT